VLILRTDQEQDLARIVEEQVQAVICTPSRPESWRTELAPVIERGGLLIPRTLLPDGTRDQVEAWLAELLPGSELAPWVQDALVDDILGLADRIALIAGVSRFRVRIFTEAPTSDCGFHVDTVAPGAPPWGLLRVYNGAGTSYVDPENLTSLADFYQYLSRRERLDRDRHLASAASNWAEVGQLDAEIMDLDATARFLARSNAVRVAPSGSIVAFKHVDARLHWVASAPVAPWIHCSPMQGEPRLVVNITSPQVIPSRHPRGTGAIAR
jgi:hypothetical protein